MFNNKYPYTDFHELNADWLIERLEAVEARIDGIKEEVEADMKEYVDSQLAPYITQLNSLVAEVSQLETNVTAKLAEYSAQISTFESGVNAQIAQIQANISNQISAINSITDTKIAQNNIYILDKVAESLGDVVQVINPFTGAKVTIQQMVDYLAAFHVEDSLLYSVMNERAKTYSQFNALNITYTDLLLHGNTLYV